jgi:hypothetical protein
VLHSELRLPDQVAELTEDAGPRRRPGKRLTSPERWEATQLIKSGVLDVTEYPTFDEEGQVRSPLSRVCQCTVPKGLKTQPPGCV